MKRITAYLMCVVIFICAIHDMKAQPDAPEASTSSNSLTSAELDKHLFPGSASDSTSQALSLVFNGYRRAMFEPCGCINYVLGGMDKEARLTARLTELNLPFVHVDAGGFMQEPTVPGAALRSRYQVQLFQLAHLDAINVSFHDLGHGLGLLRETATSNSLPLISCNITDASNSPIFMPTLVVSRQLMDGREVRVGFIGATRLRVRPSGNPVPAPAISLFQILDPEKCIRENLPNLRSGCDLLVLLYYDTAEATRQLVQNLGTQYKIDIAVSGESPGKVATPQQLDGTWYFSGGFEGRQVGHAVLQFADNQVTTTRASMIEVVQSLSPVPELSKTIEEYRARVGGSPAR